MILFEPRLALRRLIVTSRGIKVYDQKFHDGVNIIRGRNSSGKSTIADFIFFALGGDFNRWKLEAERCQEVFAEVEVNSKRITLRREVTPKIKQPLYIFWDDFEKAQSSVVEGWQLYPFSRVEPKESFSQMLFRALGLPEVKTETDNSVTMHQLLRLMYVDQISSIESLFRSEDFDHPLIRQAVGDVMLGVYDDSIYSDEISLRESQKEGDEIKREIDSLTRLYADIDQEIDLDAIKTNIEKTNEQLRKLSNSLTEDSNKIGESDSVDFNNQFEMTRSRVVALREKYNRELDEKTHQELEISDSEAFIESLNKRLKALDESLITSVSFGEMELTHCPKCLSPLIPLEGSLLNHCNLCRSELPEGARKTQTLRMQQELSLQIKESRSLLDDKKKRLEQINAELPFLTQELANSDRELTQMLNEIQGKRNVERDSMVLLKGQLEGKLQYYHQQARAAALLSDLRSRKAMLQSRVENLGASIAAKRKTKAERLTLAHTELEKFTKAFLHSDLSRENAFKVAGDVVVDFRGDAYSVDGRNQFSASSMTYLKNSIHFALLFASLNLDFMRYPRFILCDNTEDKGMEEVRSQNFQKLVVGFSKAADVAHQIIFTTSMIDPSLDNPEFCIGPFYNDIHHTLEFPRD